MKNTVGLSFGEGMYIPLSKRINPTINCLKYPETTKEFKNQVIGILVSYLEDLDLDVSYLQYLDDSLSNQPISDGFAGSIITKFNMSTGYSTRCPGQYYGVKEFHKLLLELNNEDFFDFLDICTQVIYHDDLKSRYSYDRFISKLNTVMKMNGVDLKIEDGHCIRISEPTIQEEVISPAFVELNKKGFINAQSDLWDSFEFFKKGDNEKAIQSANKALEATIDYIMKEKDWTSEKDKMPNKLECLIRSGVLPKEYESNFNNLITLLQTSSVIRNRHGGHGTADEYSVDDLYVQYAIDSAASAILFLVRLCH